MIAPVVSIVIPTRNGAATLPALLDAIWRQRVGFAIEVIAIDSGSTDGTRDLLAERHVEVLTVDRKAFDHGATRNRAIARASGAFVVLMVQDAEPASETWLASLVAPLTADASLAGTFARQQARPDAGAITRTYLSRWVAGREEARTAAIAGSREFDDLSPAERLDRCAFDNVCACIRRSVWVAHPFPATPIAEDLAWAKDVLLAGHRLRYVPDAVVWHSHDRSSWYEFSRTRVLHEQLYTLFGLRTIPTLPALARAILSSMALHVRLHRGGPPSMGRALGWAIAWPLGQYVGGRAAARGRAPVRITGV